MLTLLFLVLWLLFAVVVRAIALQVAPSLRGQRWTLIGAGLVGLALAWPAMRQISGSAPGGAASLEWPRGTNPPLPEAVSTATLARVPFTVVGERGFTARAAFIEASRRRPVAFMALRLDAETTLPVQRYLLLYGDTLQYVVDERRRRDGRGELYGFALDEVRLARCAGRRCEPVETTSPEDSAAAYRILGRFPGDTAWAVQF